MKVLIQQAYISDPGSPYNSTTQDILINSGIIEKIDQKIDADADQVISGDKIRVSPGWVDVFSNFADPGYEYKETIETGAAAAAAGGFTDVFVIPNTKPVTDNKSQVEYIRTKSSRHTANVHPIGAVSKNTEGKDLAEMYDMFASGAIAFSDGTNPIQSAGILLKALQYVKAINAVIIQVPDDNTVGTHGLINEGIVSTRLGLPGKPMMAEELQVARDIKLARYTGSRLHITGITSPKSVEYVRRAKDGGIDVTCSVTPYHLLFSDEDMETYDTNLKVFPPLRGRTDRQLLREAVIDGTVDCISSHHMPHEKDSKMVEFEYAKYGMTGLETAFLALHSAIPELSEKRLVELFSTNARKIFGMDQAFVDQGKKAAVTIYSYEGETHVNASFFRSKNINSPFLGHTFKGRIYGILNGNALFLNN